MFSLNLEKEKAAKESAWQQKWSTLDPTEEEDVR